MMRLQKEIPLRPRKLSKPDVAEIRVLYAKGLRAWSYATLAKRFNVSPATIRDVVKFDTWRRP
jgi:uncharacterized protein YjcR